jgi:hypothetical protein
MPDDIIVQGGYLSVLETKWLAAAKVRQVVIKFKIRYHRRERAKLLIALAKKLVHYWEVEYAELRREECQARRARNTVQQWY